MNISFSTNNTEVRTLDNHRKAVEDFIAALADGQHEQDEAKALYEELLEELSFAEDEAGDLDGSNKHYGIVYGFQPYEVESLYEDLVDAWLARFGD
jgi:ABC-type nitrate/sulfonate/bicarbonate transport system substrate-binding protein